MAQTVSVSIVVVTWNSADDVARLLKSIDRYLKGLYEVVFVVNALFPAILLPRPLRFRCEPWRAPRTREVAWLTGACIAARRELLLELGPFDEKMHLFSEDMDLGMRARERRIRSVFAPDVARV